MKINKEGYGILAYTAAIFIVIMLAAVFLLPIIGSQIWVLWVLIGVLVTLFFFVACFFREPKRERITDRDVVFAPVDGRVVVVEEVEETEFLNERRIQVSVFMSIANVHVNWYPVGGKVVYTKYHPGRFLVAWHPKSSTENERMSTVVDNGKCKILFRQIAGLVARRIVNYAKVGDVAEQNTKFGFIKFGSRIDMFLPLDAEILVVPGDRVRGTQTPIAKLKI